MKDSPLIILKEVQHFSELPKDFISGYHTHLLCLKGRMSFDFNKRKMHCKAGDFVFWFAESKVENLSFSKNFKSKILLVEKQFLLDNIPDQNWGIDATLFSRENPVKKPEDKLERRKILASFEALHDRFLETDHRFYSEALRLQMQIFVLEMWHLFARHYERRKRSLQSGTHFEKFIVLVEEHCLKEREVQFYSRQLNITPKYLNHISKATSGITASEWIQRYVQERLIILLQNKNLNIAEIADEMEFSSRSFFTRYVKKVLGVTPTEYRQRLNI